ncbi:MAG: shikimate kinase [Cellulosilyticum sp.]|nr:shikimate kinase [Cellulosilyticum sp.]
MTICLIGFMGSGKTTIGKELKEMLGKKWIDLDEYIEIQEGKKISDIFEQKGESYFRELEHIYLKQLINEGVEIISTGGGIITTPKNSEMLQKTCSIYLEYPFDVLYQRIEGDNNRPLATSYEALKTRFLNRLDLYEKAAQVKINCRDKSINEIAQEIITYLKK